MHLRPDPGTDSVNDVEWLEITLSVPSAAVDPATALLDRFGVGGSVANFPFVEDDEHGTACLAQSAAVRVSCYLPAAAWLERQAALQSALTNLWPLWPETGLVPPDLEMRRWRREEWERAWERFAQVVHCGRLAIVPHGRHFQPRPGEAVVELEGGAAFGTGQHPTTRMVLDTLVRILVPGQVVLDFGTGSGILACAAGRLGALRVDAVDYDSAAVETAQRNAVLNRVEKVVRVSQASTPPSGPYDVVVANITAKTLARQSKKLASVTRPGGSCILGGVIDTQLKVLTNVLAVTSLEVEEIECDGEWRTIHATRPPRLSR